MNDDYDRALTIQQLIDNAARRRQAAFSAADRAEQRYAGQHAARVRRERLLADVGWLCTRLANVYSPEPDTTIGFEA